MSTDVFHLLPERDRGRRRSLRSLRPGAAAPAPTPARSFPPGKTRALLSPKGPRPVREGPGVPTRRARAGRGPRRGEARAGVSGHRRTGTPVWRQPGSAAAAWPPPTPRRARSSPLAVRSSRGSPSSGVASAAIGGRGGAGGPRGHPGRSSWTRPRPAGPAPGPVRPREGGAPGPRSPSAHSTEGVGPVTHNNSWAPRWCFGRGESRGRARPRGRGPGMHRVSGASGDVLAREPPKRGRPVG